MKSLVVRLTVLVMLVVFGVIFSQTPKTAQASPQYCGQGTYACGSLSENGTCCWSDSQKCCYVSPGRGSCYCVLRGDACDRY